MVARLLTMCAQFLQLELNNIHKAPKVRLTLGIFSFIRTPLLDGHTNQSAFLYPMLHVDSVGERLVEAAYSGYGSTIYMPGIMRYLAVAVSPLFALCILIMSCTGLHVNLHVLGVLFRFPFGCRADHVLT